MPWFKVDDAFEGHPKVKSIPRKSRLRCIGLWTLAGSWSASHLTDGRVPAYMLQEFGATEIDARTLVLAGLWTEARGEYFFHDWQSHQPSREKVLEGRTAAKERMREARERKKAARSQDVRANISEVPAKFARSSQSVRSTPTRPDPTRPDPKDKDADSLPLVVAPDEPTSAVALVAEPSSQTAQTLVAEWIDHCQQRPPGRVIGQVAKELGLMLAEGIDPERVRAGLVEWSTKGIHPSTLASVVHEVSLRPVAVSRKQRETDALFDRAANRMGITQ